MNGYQECQTLTGALSVIHPTGIDRGKGESMANELAILDNFDKAKALIVKADLAEAVDYINKGEALKVYATKAKKGGEIQNQCAEIKIRAERRAGEILKEMEKNPGQLFRGNTMQPREDTPKLSDLGISKVQSYRWQTEALVPEKTFQEHVAKINAAKQELTSVEVQRLGSQIAGKARRQSERMAIKLQRLREIEEQGIYLGSVWDYGARANYAGDPNFHGNSIPQVIENAILFYTKKNDLILDPMAGSGTTIDVCQKLDRRCIAFDIKSVRDDIKDGNARHLKLESESIDFIFLHPPYWKLVIYTQADEKRDDLSRLDYDAFLKAMTDVSRECHRLLKPGKALCLLIGDLVTEGQYKPIAIPLYNQLSRLMTPIGIAIKTTKGSKSQVLKGKIVWAEVAMTKNLKIEHDFVMLFRKNG